MLQGGLPVVIATPAHGTAFDIAGKNLASVASTQSAFDIAVTMATRRIVKEERGESLQIPIKALPKISTVEVHACC